MCRCATAKPPLHAQKQHPSPCASRRRTGPASRSWAAWRSAPGSRKHWRRLRVPRQPACARHLS
eukprot:847368-Pyramimonas_sp.AAC.1